MTESQQELQHLASRLGPDELRVLVEVARRLRHGRYQYGELRLGTDQRDFRREAAEEILDACAYIACSLLRDTIPSPPPKPGSGEWCAVEGTLK